MSENQNPTPAQIEMQDRVDLIADLMIKGLDERDIIRFCTEKHADWNVDETELQVYILAAHEQFREAATTINPQTEMVKAHRRLEMIFSQSMRQQDLQTAQRANETIIRLLGLDNKES